MFEDHDALRRLPTPMNDPADPPRTGLGRSAMFGAASQILSRGGRTLVGVATVAILSRYMGPAEFGIAALILFVTLFAQVLSDFGLRIALVQKAEVSELELDSVFWFSVGIGIAISCAAFFGAELIARGFGEPGMAPYLKMIAPVFTVAAARGIPMALLERAFRFPTIAGSEIAGAVAGSAVAIAAAVAGYTVEALILQQIVMACLPAIMNFVSVRWLPRLQFSLGVIHPMMGFGASVTATAMIGFLSGNIDRPMLATRLSARDLGLFSMAGQIVATPVRTVAMNARRVTFPIFASMQDDNDRVVTAHRDSLHAMFLLLAPICFGLAAISDPFVDVLLGPKWGMVGEIVGVSAISALLWSIAEMNGAIFTSKGAVRFLLGWSIFALAATVAIIVLAAPYGLLAIVWARFAWTFVDVPLHCWFLGRLLGCSPVRFLSPLWRPVLAAGGMGLLVAGFDHYLGGMALGSEIRLVAGVVIGVGAYGALILLLDRGRVLELLKRVRGRRGKLA